MERRAQKIQFWQLRLFPGRPFPQWSGTGPFFSASPHGEAYPSTTSMLEFRHSTNRFFHRKGCLRTAQGLCRHSSPQLSGVRYCQTLRTRNHQFSNKPALIKVLHYWVANSQAWCLYGLYPICAWNLTPRKPAALGGRFNSRWFSSSRCLPCYRQACIPWSSKFYFRRRTLRIEMWYACALDRTEFWFT